MNYLVERSATSSSRHLAIQDSQNGTFSGLRPTEVSIIVEVSTAAQQRLLRGA